MAPSWSAAQQLRRETLVLVTMGGEHTIDIEVAATPDQQQRGLMFRRSMPANAGMLFPYHEPRELHMWMQNTFLPLDMVFIRADGTVHRIEKNTEPFSERIISSSGDVTAVLELNAGAADRLGLKPGDKVRHSHFGTAAPYK